MQKGISINSSISSISSSISSSSTEEGGRQEWAGWGLGGRCRGRRARRRCVVALGGFGSNNKKNSNNNKNYNNNGSSIATWKKGETKKTASRRRGWSMCQLEVLVVASRRTGKTAQ